MALRDHPFLPSEDGFLALDGADAFSPEDAKAIIIPFGLEASVSYGGGTGAGPEAMINASHEVELFDEELWKEAFRDYGVATYQPFQTSTDIAPELERLDGIVEGVLAAGKFPLVFGGEHSLTPGAIRPFVRRYPDLAVLHFDAHADLRDGYEGEHYSHASALRRVLDHDEVQKLVSVGIRNISASEIPYLESQGERICVHWGKDRAQWNVDDIVNQLGDRPVYLTFDLDGFDSSVMPATGTPEPGGLFWPDAMSIIRKTAQTHTIVGADIVELAPIKGFHASDFLAAKLAHKILNLSLSS